MDFPGHSFVMLFPAVLILLLFLHNVVAQRKDGDLMSFVTVGNSLSAYLYSPPLINSILNKFNCYSSPKSAP